MCHPCVWNNRRIAGGSGSRLGCCGWVVAGAGQAVISLAARSSLGLGHHWATTGPPPAIYIWAEQNTKTIALPHTRLRLLLAPQSIARFRLHLVASLSKSP